MGTSEPPENPTTGVPEALLYAPASWRGETLRKWLADAWLTRRWPGYEGLRWALPTEGFWHRDLANDNGPRPVLLAVIPMIYGKWWQYDGLQQPPGDDTP